MKNLPSFSFLFWDCVPKFLKFSLIWHRIIWLILLSRKMKIGGTWVRNPRKEKKMMVSFSSTSAYNFFSASYFVFLKFTFHFYNYDSDATLMPYLLVLIYICFIIYDIIFVWMKWICTITLHIDRQLQDDWINIVFLIDKNTFYIYCFLFFSYLHLHFSIYLTVMFVNCFSMCLTPYLTVMFVD